VNLKNIISWEDAQDLMHKLLQEKIPLHAHLVFPNGTQFVLSGLLDSATDGRLCISAASPPSSGAGYFLVPLKDRYCQFAYSELREMSKEVQEQVSPEIGKSVLGIKFEDGEYLALIFDP
jgi:hypothetical protein